MSEMKKETNLEHYKEELKELIEEAHRTDDCIVITTTGEFGLCNHTDCDKCIGQRVYECRGRIGIEILDFLMQEYKPVPTITAKEKAVLELLQYPWIARDLSGDLCAYSDKPFKDMDEDFWDTSKEVFVLCFGERQINGLPLQLDFIKWEDHEPWKVSDLLQLQVKE